ncbi:MAG TPA: AAA family ATPase [Thermoanaerobaculia bacterium]|nr:AAA family ATPase [Thermoanaerobaculia bacterium]
MSDSTFLTTVILENYKSIGRCDVALGPLSFLVGANGSGKSNFLDALTFVADSLRSSLDHAIRGPRRHQRGTAPLRWPPQSLWNPA